MTQEASSYSAGTTIDRIVGLQQTNTDGQHLSAPRGLSCFV
jgi:hypothetical protein